MEFNENIFDPKEEGGEAEKDPAAEFLLMETMAQENKSPQSTKEHSRPKVANDYAETQTKEIKDCIENLNAHDYKIRQEAKTKLKWFGMLAIPELESALSGKNKTIADGAAEIIKYNLYKHTTIPVGEWLSKAQRAQGDGVVDEAPKLLIDFLKLGIGEVPNKVAQFNALKHIVVNEALDFAQEEHQDFNRIFDSHIDDFNHLLDVQNGLKNMQRLNLSEARISENGLDPLRRLPKLSQLKLCNAKITDKELSRLNVPLLTRLDLSYTNINGAGLTCLENLPRLREMHLNSVPLTDDSITNLHSLPNLSILGLESTWDSSVAPVSDKSLSHLLNLLSHHASEQAGTSANLQDLYLGSTKISDAGLANISLFRNLEVLDLTGTKVTDSGLTYLQDLSKLKSLRLRSTNITDSGLAHITNLSNLELLSLADTKITDNSAGNLAKFVNLKELNLKDAMISDKAIDELVKLKKLEVLSINGTAITSAGFLQLVKVLPNLRQLDVGGCKKIDAKTIEKTKEINTKLAVST